VPQDFAAAAPRGRILLAAGALLLVALAVYANIVSAPFVLDDVPGIRDNPTIRALASGFSPPPSSGLPVSGRPLANFSFALNYALGGLAVRGYHVTNIAIHALAALALFGLVRRTLLAPRLRDRFGAAALPLAFSAALVWLVHPLATAAVTYTVERTESLAALWYLLTLYTLARALPVSEGGARGLRPSKLPRSEGGPQRAGWLTLSITACALGMMTKEVMVSAPLLALLYDRTFASGTWGEAWRRRAPYYAALAATWLLLAYCVLSTGGRGGTAGFATEISVPAYAFTQCVAIVRYLALALWPRSLVFDYGTEVVSDWSLIAPCALLVLALGIGTVLALRRWPALGWLGVAFLAVLAPSSSIVPIATQTLAEHRMYLPLAAIALLAVLGAYRWLGSRSYYVIGAAVVLLALLTVRRNSTYRSEEALWRDTVAARPQNARAQCSLADALFAADRIDEALPLYAEAIRLKPGYAEAHLNFGSALLARGRAADALPELEAALRLQPTWAKTQRNLARADLQLNRTPEALAHFALAARLRPDDATTYCDWGNALARSGDLASAVAQYEEAIRREPEFVMAQNNLANALAQSGQFTAAIPHYETALRLAPNYAEGHNNLASALAQAGRPNDAIAQYEAALRLRPDYGEAHENLARVLKFLGQDAAAEQHFAAARRAGRIP